MKKLFIFPLLIFIACSEPKKEVQQQEKDFCSSIHRSDSITLSKELLPVSDLMKNKTGVYLINPTFGS